MRAPEILIRDLPEGGIEITCFCGVYAKDHDRKLEAIIRQKMPGDYHLVIRIGDKKPVYL
jgi:hypothetical protein